jgi:2-C-methyl-D-erythritol 4-phosphate cytidylyltransferase
MGFNKLLAPLAGEPVIVHSVRAFEACAGVHDIFVVAGEDMAEALRAVSFTKLRKVVPGGSERHFSVAAGLAALSEGTELVAVHDGGRPLISVEQISRCLEQAAQHGAVACARRATETMKQCDPAGRIIASIPREDAWIMETPQVFRRELLDQAYRKVLADGVLVTDEVSAVQHLGESVWVVENATPNPKVTLPGDLALVESLLNQRTKG